MYAAVKLSRLTKKDKETGQSKSIAGKPIKEDLVTDD